MRRANLAVLAVGFLSGCATVAGKSAVDARLVAFCGPAAGRSGTGEWVQAHAREILAYDPPLPPAGTLVGLVVDHAGQPIEAASVLLRKGSVAPGDTAVQTVITTAGTFRLDSLEQRDYILDIRRLGYERQWHAYRGIRGLADTLCIPMRALPIVLSPITSGSR